MAGLPGRDAEHNGGVLALRGGNRAREGAAALVRGRAPLSSALSRREDDTVYLKGVVTGNSGNRDNRDGYTSGRRISCGLLRLQEPARCSKGTLRPRLSKLSRLSVTSVW